MPEDDGLERDPEEEDADELEEEPFMYCPICHIAATVGDSLQIDACRHLEAAFRMRPGMAGRTGLRRREP